MDIHNDTNAPRIDGPHAGANGERRDAFQFLADQRIAAGEGGGHEKTGDPNSPTVKGLLEQGLLASYARVAALNDPYLKPKRSDGEIVGGFAPKRDAHFVDEGGELEGTQPPP